MIEQVDVIIKQNVPFIAGYMDALEKLDDEYILWIKENIGEYVTYVRTYSMSESNQEAAWRFTFYTEEDALAFKLRWL